MRSAITTCQRGPEISCLTSESAGRLRSRDRIDTLVGAFGAGLVPTGSADPFALRRAAIAVVRLALEGTAGVDWDLSASFDAAYDLFPSGSLAERAQVMTALDAFFRARLKAHFTGIHAGDLVLACLGAWDGRSLRDFGARLDALARFRALPAYDSLAVAFKRAYNIAKEAPTGEILPDLLEAGPEQELASRFLAVAPKLEAATESGSYDDAFRAVAEELKVPIDRFFEEVFVMVDDPELRANRLRLLGSIARSISRLAHFHELST